MNPLNLIRKDQHPWFLIAVGFIFAEVFTLGTVVYVINSTFVAYLFCGFVLGQVFAIYIATVIATLVFNESRLISNVDTTNG